MNKNTQVALSMEDRIKRLDDIGAKASSVVFTDGQNFSAAIAMAQHMSDLLELIDDEILETCMNLMNTSLGFKTDRDPARQRPGKPPVEAYGREVVKRCVCEAVLMGVQLVKNQFNIISANTYITREGFGYMLKKLTDLKNLEVILGVPKPVPGNASEVTVNCKARWIYKGNEGGIGWKEGDPACNIVIRVDQYTSPDAINGKAERKFRKRIYEQVTGQNVPDGDATDFEQRELPPTKKAELPQGATEAAGASQPQGELSVLSVNDTIKAWLKESELSDDEVLEYAKKNGFAGATVGDLYALADDKLRLIVKNGTAIAEAIKKAKGGKK